MAKNGLHLITPTSIAYTGTSATISANGSVTFSACSVLSLNGVFSADYDNYMVVGWHDGTTTPASYHNLRFRSSGVDNTTASSYVWQYLEADSTTVQGSRTTANYGAFTLSTSTQSSGLVMNIYGPYLSQPTAYRSYGMNGTNNARIGDFAGTHNQSTSYDGLTIYGTNAIAGRVAVYGMRK